MPTTKAPRRATATATAVRPAVKAVSSELFICPRCGRLRAHMIGRSETLPVVYLHCGGCNNPSVARA